MANRLFNRSTVDPTDQRFGQTFYFEAESFESFRVNLNASLLLFELQHTETTTPRSIAEPNSRFSQTIETPTDPSDHLRDVGHADMELDFEIDVRWM